MPQYDLNELKLKYNDSPDELKRKTDRLVTVFIIIAAGILVFGLLRFGFGKIFPLLLIAVGIFFAGMLVTTIAVIQIIRKKDRVFRAEMKEVLDRSDYAEDCFQGLGSMSSQPGGLEAIIEWKVNVAEALADCGCIRDALDLLWSLDPSGNVSKELVRDSIKSIREMPAYDPSMEPEEEDDLDVEDDLDEEDDLDHGDDLDPDAETGAEIDEEEAEIDSESDEEGAEGGNTEDSEHEQVDPEEGAEPDTEESTGADTEEQAETDAEPDTEESTGADTEEK